VLTSPGDGEAAARKLLSVLSEPICFGDATLGWRSPQASASSALPIANRPMPPCTAAKQQGRAAVVAGR
jgi:hypothetical protein